MVVDVVATRETTEPLLDSELETLASEIADNLGVSEANVTLDVEYSIGGTITVDVDENISSEEVETMIETVLAETLGIHPQHIETSYNPKTGEVSKFPSCEFFLFWEFYFTA